MTERTVKFTRRSSSSFELDEISLDNNNNVPDPRISIQYHNRRTFLSFAFLKSALHLEPETKSDVLVKDHILSKQQLFEAYATSEDGLSEAEVTKRLASNGPNVIKPPPRAWNAIKKVLLEFVSGFSILLWVAALLCFLAWKPFGAPPDPNNFGLALIIVLIIFFGAAFNLIQEYRSRKIMDSIAKLIPGSVKVIRSGEEQLLSPTQLVVGDLVLLSAGDKVPVTI